MSKADLLKIIGAFPEKELENIILSSMREMFFNGDWGSADSIVEYILASNVNENLRGRIASFGIFIAARARDIKKALDRYRYLESLEANETIICQKAEGLLHLSDLLLPDEVPLLLELWQKSLQIKLPRMAQEKYAAIGALLCEQFSQIHDVQSHEKIINLMEQNLDSRIYEKIVRQINLPHGKYD